MKRAKSFKVYSDSDFCGNWCRLAVSYDPSTAKLRSGSVLIYVGCLIVWDSELQMAIDLSSIQAGCVSLSHSLRYLIPLMVLIKEMKTFGFEIFLEERIVHCKAFDDNYGAIGISRLPKIRPRTKHTNVVFHHFPQYVHKGRIHIQQVSTGDQGYYTWTKLLLHNIFLKYC